ncbi:ENTH domain-containing protein, partial [Neolecta irregularis DAH-3]
CSLPPSPSLSPSVSVPLPLSYTPPPPFLPPSIHPPTPVSLPHPSTSLIPISHPPPPTMGSSFEKSVKGATKIKLAVPKSKYVEHILLATRTGEAGLGEVFRALAARLHDPSWTIVFKALLLVHIMIRDGAKDATLDYLSRSPRLLDTAHLSGVIDQGVLIRNYGKYLQDRAIAFEKTKIDHVAELLTSGRLRSLSPQKGLLREVEIVQRQLASLLRCKFNHAPEHDIALAAFRLLLSDLKPLFQAANEAVINVLEHYFEMSFSDAERALAIYKIFVKQTLGVVEYFNTARRLESITRLATPIVKHAPTSLTKALEEYLNDPDFEENRRQYLQNKNSSSSANAPKVESRRIAIDDKTNPFSPSFQPLKQNDVNLIDFSPNEDPHPISPGLFSQPQLSYAQVLDTNQQSNPYPFQHQNPYLPQSQQFSLLQPTFTGAGFGGFTRDADSIQSYTTPLYQPSQFPSNLQPHLTSSADTNPFRTSILPSTIFPNQTGPPNQ